MYHQCQSAKENVSRSYPEYVNVREMPPIEFMEEYTRVNETYKDEMSSTKEYLFYRFVEPTTD